MREGGEPEVCPICPSVLTRVGDIEGGPIVTGMCNRNVNYKSECMWKFHVFD